MLVNGRVYIASGMPRLYANVIYSVQRMLRDNATWIIEAFIFKRSGYYSNDAIK